MAESNSPAHQRNKSTVKNVLSRIASRVEGSPSGSRSDPEAMATSQEGAASRTSLHRPHLSTTMSNTVPVSPPPASSQAADDALASTSATQGASIEQSVRLFKIFEALRSGDTAAISKSMSSEGGEKLEGTTALHLAIQCAETAVIEYVLSQSPAAINAKDRDGNTPLHSAAMLGRSPVVKLLLEQQGINDAIANYQGKTALDLARNPEIFQQLQLTRSLFLDDVTRQIHQLVAKEQYDNLESLLNDARVKACLDVNAPELATDPVITEAGGSLLHEAARTKNLRLAQILLLNGADPFRRDRKGKLPQDITKDDRTRAILKRSPAAQAAQRSIQEKTILGDSGQIGAATSADGGPAGKDSREIKGYLRKWTNYTSGYKLRWFVLEDGVLSYYKHQDDAGSACRGAINMRIARLHMDPKDKLAFDIHGKSSVKYTLKANHQVEAKRWYWALNNAIQWAKDEAREEDKRQKQEKAAIRDARGARTSSELVAPQPPANTDQHSSYAPSVGSLRTSRNNTAAIEGGTDEDDEDDFADDLSNHEPRPVSKDAFSIAAQSAKLQLDLLEQVAHALQNEKETNPDLTISHPTVVQALVSYDTAVGNLKGLLGDLLRISRDHEAYWQYRVDREQNIRRLWEDSMARVAQEQEELETRIGESEDKRKRTKRALKEVLDNADLQREADGGADSNDVRGDGRTRRATLAELANNIVSDDDQSDNDDEFFDAVDAGEVEVLDAMPTTTSPLASPKIVATDTSAPETDGLQARETQIVKSYRGYEDGIRRRLKLDADNRPKVSLWAVLKSMIGKDMTRMTLPVSFNEPTSLLYRVVEDMEYTPLLDTAVERADSTERMVYVAGFAASIYASTIGRVAKPFNPLLGETFEYVRPDLGFRFFCEQVSHHPPIGAANAQSTRWDYYGESNVKSKFYGKSFEFNHLGTWYAHLRPVSGGEEVYTWKKVNSSVVGIITGNPVVDNYGPMEIKNWTTGEVCYLDFKARGWKASSAFQVSGRVVDASGRTRWSIGGRWNDKIYARLTPGYEADLSDGEKSGKDQAFLVWENHERPTGIPFNLTPFAVTLNALPDRLRPYIAPTDSRLRPDQRAMEEAEYDFAATEKTRVEEGQRARRRAREANGLEFQPRWFKKSRHPVTGDTYWSFDDEYWKIRDDVAEGKRKWSDETLEEIY